MLLGRGSRTAARLAPARASRRGRYCLCCALLLGQPPAMSTAGAAGSVAADGSYYRHDGVRITHDPYAPGMASKYGMPGKTDREGFDPYADSVGKGRILAARVAAPLGVHLTARRRRCWNIPWHCAARCSRRSCDRPPISEPQPEPWTSVRRWWIHACLPSHRQLQSRQR